MIVRAMHRLAPVVFAATVLAACGGLASPPKPPSPQDILSKPNHANLKDAHFLVTGKGNNQGTVIDIRGDGAVVYKSPGAGRFKFQSTVAGQLITFEDISINGTEYTFTDPGNGKWTARATTSGFGPTSFAGASGFTYVGEESLPSGKAWHAKAKDKDGNPFEGWIRESDGYPLKYQVTQTSNQGTNQLTLTFDRYNTGVTISAPPASQVSHG
jgi:outer membrane lipoprotein-sorting protein